MAERPAEAAFYKNITGFFFAVKTFFATVINKMFHLRLPPFGFFTKALNNIPGFIGV
jgi:hypothetical protein